MSQLISGQDRNNVNKKLFLLFCLTMTSNRKLFWGYGTRYLPIICKLLVISRFKTQLHDP